MPPAWGVRPEGDQPVLLLLRAGLAHGGRPGSAEFLLGDLLFEVTPERAFWIIERSGEFATRATRWSWPGRDFDDE